MNGVANSAFNDAIHDRYRVERELGRGGHSCQPRPGGAPTMPAVSSRRPLFMPAEFDRR
jgi:hypothetical protein